MIEKYSKILDSLELHPSKRLGQSFLINQRIVTEQINFAELNQDDLVLEIGPGLGVLTIELAKYVRKVVAIEYDKKLYSYLAGILPGNVELILGDALAIEFPNFTKLVSNIPYQISSPLIFKLTDYLFESAIIMLQTEFARRLTAQPNSKDYSRLTVMASYHFDIDFLCAVPKTSFFPKPKIDSVLIKFRPKKQKIHPVSEQLFFKLVKIIFSERRKMIKNSILNHSLELKISKPVLLDLIPHLPYLSSRPEDLTVAQLIELADKFYTELRVSGKVVHKMEFNNTN